MGWKFPSQCVAVAIRDVIRQGGCCASRATFAGALMGAHFAPLAEPIERLRGCVPQEWVRKTAEASLVKDRCMRIVRFRSSVMGGTGDSQSKSNMSRSRM